MKRILLLFFFLPVFAEVVNVSGTSERFPCHLRLPRCIEAEAKTTPPSVLRVNFNGEIGAVQLSFAIPLPFPSSIRRFLFHG